MARGASRAIGFPGFAVLSPAYGLQRRLPRLAVRPLVPFLAGDAPQRRWIGVETRPAYRLAAVATGAVAAVVDARERGIDLLQLGDVARDHRDVHVGQYVCQ